MTNKLPISACIIAKNESLHIANCIRSLKFVVKEINLVDTGSSDETIQIAIHEGAIIHKYNWNDDFSAARNFAISIASQPYILMIDADEALDQATITFLEEFINRPVKEPAAVTVRSIIDEHRTVNSFLTRLFPNLQQYRYKGLIHEQLYYKNQPLERVQSTNVVLNHYGYKEAEIQKKEKIDRNLILLRKQLQIEPDSIYTRFQIGQTHYVNGDYEEAIHYFDDTLQRISKLELLPSYLPTIFLSYGYCLLNTKQYDILDNLLNDASEFYPDFTDLFFLYGISLIERKDIRNFTAIREIFEYCLHLGEIKNHLYETVQGVGSYRALYNLGVYYEVTNNAEEALRCYTESAKYNFEPALRKVRK